MTRAALVFAGLLAALGIALSAFGVLALSTGAARDRERSAAADRRLEQVLAEQLELRDSVLGQLAARLEAADEERERLREQVLQLGGDPGPRQILPPVQLPPSMRPGAARPQPTPTPGRARPAQSPSRTPTPGPLDPVCAILPLPAGCHE